MSDLETRVAVLEARMDASGSSTERMVREMGNLQDRVSNLQDRVGDLREEMGLLRGEMRAEIGNLRGEMNQGFAVVHREIAKQSKFLLALALGAATLVSVLLPVVLKLLR